MHKYVHYKLTLQSAHILVQNMANLAISNRQNFTKMIEV